MRDSLSKCFEIEWEDAGSSGVFRFHDGFFFGFHVVENAEVFEPFPADVVGKTVVDFLSYLGLHFADATLPTAGYVGVAGAMSGLGSTVETAVFKRASHLLFGCFCCARVFRF